MDYIPRTLQQVVEKSIASKKILILLGARQVGKTTLIQHVLQSHSGEMLNMDFEIDRNQLIAASKKDISEVTRAFGAGNLIVIDEAQRLKNIGRIVKGWYDKQIDLKIVLLGSSSDALVAMAGSELVGRNEKVHLTPLLFREILEQQTWYTAGDTAASTHEFFNDQVRAMLLERIVYGSYPEAYNSHDPRQYLKNLVGDYLLKDMFTSSAIRSPEDIRRLLIELAGEVGNVVAVSQLATRTNLSRQTVTRYLDLLEGISVIFSIPSYSTDPVKESNHSHKYYFWDTGVRNELLREWTVSEGRTDIDALWENWVMAEIAKLRLTYLRHEDLFFWQSRNGSTVDLVIKQGSDLHPFDFRFHADEAKPSRAFKNMYGMTTKTVHPDNVLEVLL